MRKKIIFVKKVKYSTIIRKRDQTVEYFNRKVECDRNHYIKVIWAFKGIFHIQWQCAKNLHKYSSWKFFFVSAYVSSSQNHTFHRRTIGVVDDCFLCAFFSFGQYIKKFDNISALFTNLIEIWVETELIWHFHFGMFPLNIFTNDLI